MIVFFGLSTKGRLRGGFTHSPLPGRGVGKGVSVGEQRFYQLRDNNENICKEDKTQLIYYKEKLDYFNVFSVLSTGYNNFQFIYFVINITCQYAILPMG